MISLSQFKHLICFGVFIINFEQIFLIALMCLYYDGVISGLMDGNHSIGVLQNAESARMS